jgi:hypothetical protein
MSLLYRARESVSREPIAATSCMCCRVAAERRDSTLPPHVLAMRWRATADEDGHFCFAVVL